jgi:phospholipase C
MAVNQLSTIQSIVVLMLENRSFDHMLGMLYSSEGNVAPSGQPYEGLTGKEANPDKNGKPVLVYPIEPTTKNAYFLPGADPGEGYQSTNLQLFGSSTPSSPPLATNQGFVTNFDYTLGWEAGKAGWTPISGTVAGDIMGVYSPSTLPVLSGLARGFAVCDQWFCSAPTETLPNRAFACAATSQGHMDDNTKTYTSQSIFSLLSKNKINWAIYGYTSSPLTRLNFPDTKNAPNSHFGLFKDFQAAAAAGTLPPYSFLEPSWGATGNSQHPNYSVALGEQLIHDVYYALRNGPRWNQTLLIVTYDEHGGCYDHVAPPTNAVPPDASIGEFGFDFKRFGPRVPTLLVSPLIAAGTVFRVPAGSMPLDHTSILKTVGTCLARTPRGIDHRDTYAGAVHTAATTVPPGRKHRRVDSRARRGPSKYMRPQRHRAASNACSGTPVRVSPSVTRMVRFVTDSAVARSLAKSSMSSEISVPRTKPPGATRVAARSAGSPRPMAMSSIRDPGRSPARSSIRSLTCADSRRSSSS